MKATPCLLVRHKHRHTNHHAAASLPFDFVSVPLGATHDTNATRPATSTTPPPCPPPTRCAGGPARTVACEAEYFFRVVVVVVSSAVRLGSSGTTPNAPPSRKPGTGFRALVKYDLKRTRCPLFRTCLVAFVRDDGAERRPGTCEHFRCWVVHELPWAGLLIIIREELAEISPPEVCVCAGMSRAERADSAPAAATAAAAGAAPAPAPDEGAVAAGRTDVPATAGPEPGPTTTATTPEVGDLCEKTLVSHQTHVPGDSSPSFAHADADATARRRTSRAVHGCVGAREATRVRIVTLVVRAHHTC
jgi:hypothetical protein